MRLPACLIASLLLCVSAASTASAQGPRVGVVVSGDPAELVVASAHGLAESLAAGGAVALPSDPSTVAALEGAPGTASDGLDELRGLRRRLGITNDGDREVLDLIGARLELVVLVVVRGATSPTARVYDVNEHRFFTGEASLSAENLGAARDFVVARAEAARQRRDAPPPATAATATPDPAAAPATAAPSPTEEPPPRRSFMRRNWPFFVAGALLVGVTTYFIVDRRNDSPSAPVIHIRPGGN